MTNHIIFMREALKEAEKASKNNEVPIGAVIVKDGIIIGRGHNTRESGESVLGHAEINAIEAASRFIGDWRLTDTDIYVTIEPCPMCCGAIYQSRIRTIIYGASDLKAGACGGLFQFFSVPGLNHYCHVIGNCLETECSQIVRDFFKHKRK